MMPERMGIIGKVQGVNASSNPKPKKVSSASGTLLEPSTLAMRLPSSPETAEAGADEVVIPASAGGASLRARARSSRLASALGGGACVARAMFSVRVSGG